jgi:hypothetical protein
VGAESSCQTCQYVSRVLQRPAACEQHARRVPPEPTPELDGLPVFRAGEIIRMLALRTRLRQQLQPGQTPDDLPARLWRDADR